MGERFFICDDKVSHVVVEEADHLNTYPWTVELCQDNPEGFSAGTVEGLGESMTTM